MVTEVPDRYVVYFHERLRDGQEEWAKVVTGIAAALEAANTYADGINRHNKTILLFKLGQQVPLAEVSVEEPQPPVTRVRLVLDTHGGQA